MSEKITILYLRHSSGGGGGADTVILNLAAHIDTNQFLVIVVYLRNFKEDISLISEQSKEKGITFFEFPGIRFFDIKQFLNIVELVKKYNIKIVHCHDPKSDVYGFLLKVFLPKLRLVGTIHGWIQRRMRSVLYIKIAKFLLRRFDAVIAVSQDLEQDAKRDGIKNTYLIHNAIDTNLWKRREDVSKSAKSPFVVGFIGRISREKGPFDFVNVAKKVIEQDTDYEFWVAGEGPEEEALKDLVKKFNLEDKFHFIGQLTKPILFDLYQKLDLLLLTSYTEGLPMVVLEACAMSVPVVTTNVGGVKEIIIHNYNGLLADAGDIDCLTRNVIALKKDKELIEKIKKNGRITVENEFSFKAAIEKIEAFYKAMI